MTELERLAITQIYSEILEYSTMSYVQGSMDTFDFIHDRLAEVRDIPYAATEDSARQIFASATQQFRDINAIRLLLQEKIGTVEEYLQAYEDERIRRQAS